MKHPVMLFLALVAPVAGAHAQNVLTVDNNPGAVAMFGSFSAAYDAAEPGDTILLAGSSASYGNREIFKEIHIVGPGYHLALNNIPGLNNQPAIFTPLFRNSTQFGDSSGSTVTGISVTAVTTSTLVGANVTDIIFDKVRFGRFMTFESPVVIRRSYQQGSSNADAMTFNAGATGSIVTHSNLQNVTVQAAISASFEHCIIRRTFSSGGLVSVANTIFANPAELANPISDSSASFSHCIAIAGNYLPEGGGNINGQFLTGQNGVFDLFGNNNDDRVRLHDDSSALVAGTGGSDIGITGGASPYVPGGVPGNPRLTRLVVPATATDTSGLAFEVDAQTFSD